MADKQLNLRQDSDFLHRTTFVLAVAVAAVIAVVVDGIAWRVFWSLISFASLVLAIIYWRRYGNSPAPTPDDKV
ncbi:MAG: hypothetical protein EXS05_16565 [Planctomycetaceae bacterium]|nr:hypothetical protein [Planctomycetaceae bacterium]